MRPIPTLWLLFSLLSLPGCGEGEGAAAARSPDRAGAAPSGAKTDTGLQPVNPAHPAHPGFVDMGPIPLGEVREHALELANREGRPLTVRSIQTGCACTIPSLTYTGPDGQLVRGNMRGPGDVLTLPAGVTAELLLRVDSRVAPVRNKPKLVTVRIVTDSERNPFTTLEVRVFVDSPFRTAPDAVDIGRVATHGGGSGATRIFQAGDARRSLVDVLEVPEGLSATLSPSDYLGEPAWALEVRALPPVRLGYATHVVQLATTGPGGEGEGEPFAVEVRVTGVPDVEVRPTRFLLRPLAAGQLPLAEVVLLAHMPGQRLLVQGAEISGTEAEKLRVELIPSRPDEAGASAQWLLRLEALEELGPEGVHGTVTLALDDEQIGALEVPYLSLPQRP